MSSSVRKFLRSRQRFLYHFVVFPKNKEMEDLYPCFCELICNVMDKNEYNIKFSFSFDKLEKRFDVISVVPPILIESIEKAINDFNTEQFMCKRLVNKLSNHQSHIKALIKDNPNIFDKSESICKNNGIIRQNDEIVIRRKK